MEPLGVERTLRAAPLVAHRHSRLARLQRGECRRLEIPSREAGDPAAAAVPTGQFQRGVEETDGAVSASGTGDQQLRQVHQQAVGKRGVAGRRSEIQRRPEEEGGGVKGESEEKDSLPEKMDARTEDQVETAQLPKDLDEGRTRSLGRGTCGESLLSFACACKHRTGNTPCSRSSRMHALNNSSQFPKSGPLFILFTIALHFFCLSLSLYIYIE